MRAHLLKAATDVAGNLLAGSVVAVYQNGTGNTTQVLISNPIYPAQTGSATLSNPYTTPDGNINFYLDAPQRVDLGITPPGASPYVLSDVDVISVLSQAVGMSLLGTTPPGGFAKQNATPTIFSWNVPNDGQPHRVALYATQYCATAETGGGIQLTYTGPGGNVINTGVLTAGATVGGSIGTAKLTPVLAGSVVSLSQSSALTAGATTVYAELWGS